MKRCSVERFRKDEHDDCYMDETQAIYHERLKKLRKNDLLKLYRERYHESHECPEKIEKIREFILEPHQAASVETIETLQEIIKTAIDERLIQEFLTKNPFLVARCIHPAHHGKVCIPKPNFGRELQPDYLIAGLDSSGFSWFGVEFENPKYKMFTKSGEETKELKHAIRQVQAWRSWLNDNIAYAQNTLGFLHIDSNLPCIIIIGRRENEVLDETTLIKRRRDIKNNDKYGLLLHHYEWLIDVQPTMIKVTD